MIKLKKLTAFVMAGMLACAAPMPVMASEADTEVVEELVNSGIDAVAENPDKAVDIIMYAKELVDQQNITDEEVRNAIDSAAEHFQVSISDSGKDSLVSVVRKMLDLNLNEEKLKSGVHKAYDKLQEVGVGKEEVKGFVGKFIAFVKGFFK